MTVLSGLHILPLAVGEVLVIIITLGSRCVQVGNRMMRKTRYPSRILPLNSPLPQKMVPWDKVRFSFALKHMCKCPLFCSNSVL